MAGAFCSRCGRPVAPGAGFCPGCGARLSGGPPQPPPFGQPWGPPPPSYGPPVPRAPRKDRTALWVTLVVGVGVVVAILALVALLGGLGAAVVVTGISYTSHDDACGMNGLTEPGFTASTRAALHVGVVVTNEAHLACTIASVGSATPGFGITGANVPLIIPGGGQAQLTYTVHPPASPYNGPLSIDVE